MLDTVTWILATLLLSVCVAAVVYRVRRRSQRRAYADLQRSEERFKSLFHAAPIAMRELDLRPVADFLVRHNLDVRGLPQHDPDRAVELVRQARAIDSNAAFFEFWGIDKNHTDLMTGTKTFDHQGDLLQATCQIVAAFQEGKSTWAGSISLRDAQGAFKHANMRASLARDDWSRALISLDDITALRTTELELERQAAEHASILETAQNVIVSITPRGIIRFISNASEHILGYHPDELVGKNIKLLMPEPFHSEHDGYLSSYQETGKKNIIGSRGRELPAVTKDGRTIMIELTVAEVRHTGEVNFVGVMKEVTELVSYRAHLEAEVERQMEDLRLALGREKELRENLEVSLLRERDLGSLRQNFVSVVSHEFRTPLAVIQSSTDLLSQYYDRMNEQQRAARLEKIRREVAHMTNLMEDVVFFDRSTSAALQLEAGPIDLEALLNEIINDTVLLGDSGHYVDIIFARPAKREIGYEVLFRRILGNLVSNALKYSETDTRITVKLGGNAKELLLMVRNEGQIEPDLVPHLFDPFTRGSRPDQPPGSGLGLAIVQRAAEAWGGSARVSTAGPPAVVLEVRLPLASPGEPEDEPGASGTDG